jgi:hypothetical protein
VVTNEEPDLHFTDKPNRGPLQRRKEEEERRDRDEDEIISEVYNPLYSP